MKAYGQPRVYSQRLTLADEFYASLKLVIMLFSSSFFLTRSCKSEGRDLTNFSISPATQSILIRYSQRRAKQLNAIRRDGYQRYQSHQSILREIALKTV